MFIQCYRRTDNSVVNDSIQIDINISNQTAYIKNRTRHSSSLENCHSNVIQFNLVSIFHRYNSSQLEIDLYRYFIDTNCGIPGGPPHPLGGDLPLFRFFGFSPYFSSSFQLQIEFISVRIWKLGPEKVTSHYILQTLVHIPFPLHTHSTLCFSTLVSLF